MHFSINQLSVSIFPWTDTTGQTWDQSTIRSHAESALIHACTRFIYLYFYYCQLVNEWGESGEAAQRDTFIRQILGIPYSDYVGYAQLVKFEQYIDAQFKRYDILDLKTEVQVKDAIENFRIDFFGHLFRLFDAETINGYLRNLNSTLYIQAGTYGVEHDLILGRGTHSQLGGYQIIDLTEEICHTANINITLAAAIGHQQIVIRHCSLRSIFEIKWRSFINNPAHSDSENGLAGAAIKHIVCQHYGFIRNAITDTKKNQFIQEMRDSILFHEIGHGIIQHHALPLVIGAFSEATKLISHPLIHTLLEILAEIAPRQGDYFGPLYYFCDLSKTNRDQAVRQFWMYVSDTWFFDTDSEFMYLYSEIVEKIFFAGAQSNTQFDFNRIESLVWGPHGMYSYLLNQTIEICNAIITFLSNQTYILDNQVINFDRLRLLKQNELQAETVLVPTAYVFESALWAKILETALSDATIKTTIFAVLNEYQSKIIEMVQDKTGLNNHKSVLSKIQSMAIYKN